MNIGRNLYRALFVVMLLSSCGRQPEVSPAATFPQAAVAPRAKATPTPEPVETPTAAYPDPSPTQTLAPELQTYLDDALDWIQEVSMDSTTTDWQNVRAQVYAFAAGAQSIPELYPAIRMALTMTGDRHGYLMPPLEAQTYVEAQPPETLPAIHQEILEGRLGWIAVPTFASGNEASVGHYAVRLQDAIRSLDAQHPCGWIVDLRNNEGGNGFAMLSGVSPLLGDGIYGYHTYADGETVAWRSQDGTMFLGETALVELPTPPYEVLHHGRPIAVLTNEITTSAGEMVAIAFRGRPHTCSFGQRTLGRTTAPKGFTLSDGAILGISVAYFTDHNGKVYRGKITPDDILVDHDNPILRDRDVPQPAIDWLLSHPACSEQ